MWVRLLMSEADLLDLAHGIDPVGECRTQRPLTRTDPRQKQYDSAGQGRKWQRTIQFGAQYHHLRGGKLCREWRDRGAALFNGQS